MKYLILLLLTLLFQGCFYLNETGMTTQLYNECKEYYTADGDYVKECPKNVVDYSEIKSNVKKYYKDLTK